MNRFVADILNSQTRKGMPIMTVPGAEMIDAPSEQLFADGTMQFEAIKALNDKFPAAAALTMMDLSVEAEAFGAPIAYSDHGNPTVTDRIIFESADIDKLLVPPVGAARSGEVLKCAALCAENIKDRPTFGGMIGPFSLAGRLADMTEMMILAAMEEENAKALLEKSTLFLIEYAKGFKESGVGGIVIAEPAAGLLSPEMARDFSFAYVKRIVDAVQDDDFTVILHNCGNTQKQVADMVDTGACGIHVGNIVDMHDIVPQVPAEVLVMGNIDPVGEFKNGTVQSIYEKSTALLDYAGTNRNFVLSSGCDLPHGVPLENIASFFKALDDYNSR